MVNAEIELKFPVDDPALLDSLLPSLGFHLDTPRTFEQNTLYDTPARGLRESRQILRLRRYGALWTLTHKRQSPDPYEAADSRYKVRIETETHLDDGPAMGAIFEHLGYAPVFRYEKYRTQWSQYGQDDHSGEALGHLVIDETPIGNYAELEGSPAWIDATIERLGIDPASCLTQSYGKLFLAWKQRTGSGAEHLTFDEINAEVLQPALG